MIDSAFPQWLFPAVASLVGLALFSGFQPAVLEYWRRPEHRRVALGAGLVFVGVVVMVMALGLVESSPWWWTLVAIAALGLALVWFVERRLARRRGVDAGDARTPCGSVCAPAGAVERRTIDAPDSTNAAIREDSRPNILLPIFGPSTTHQGALLQLAKL